MTLKQEIKDKIKTVKLQLREDKKEYYSRKKALVSQHREGRRLNKAKVQKLKKQFREEFGTVFSRATGWLNAKTSGTLIRYYDRCAVRAEDMRYSQEDPDGYEADGLLVDLKKTVENAEDRIQKGKVISKRNQELLVGTLGALEVIKKKDLGRNSDQADDLIERAKACVGPEITEALDMMNKMEEVFNSGLESQTT